MTIHIFRYSQLIDTDRMLTVKAFAECSGLLAEVIGDIAVKEEKEGGVILQYKSGKIDTPKFRSLLNELIENKGGSPLKDEVFDACWNAMCTVNSEKLSKLHQFQLEHKGCKIHVIGDTNELQHDFIGKQIALLTKKPEIEYTLSFVEHTSNREELAEVVENIYPDEEIVCHYTDQNSNGVELLNKYYANEESSLVQHDTTDKVSEGNSTDESNKTHDVVEDTIDVMGELNLLSDDL